MYVRFQNAFKISPSYIISVNVELSYDESSERRQTV